MITKTQAFVEQLNEMKYGNIFGVKRDEMSPARSFRVSKYQSGINKKAFVAN